MEDTRRYFPALLPLIEDEDPEEALERGDVPHLRELVLHNGTICRWNRPIYGITRGKPTGASRTGCCPPARRSSTSSPTRPVTSVPCGRSRSSTCRSRGMSFRATRDNFFCVTARDGIDSELFWPGVGAGPPALWRSARCHPSLTTDSTRGEPPP